MIRDQRISSGTHTGARTLTHAQTLPSPTIKGDAETEFGSNYQTWGDQPIAHTPHTQTHTDTHAHTHTYLLHNEYQNAHFTSKMRPFWGSEDILKGPHITSDVLDGNKWFKG